MSVIDFTPGEDAPRLTSRENVAVGLTLTQARRMCTRHARRGLRLYGGTIRPEPWGATGGAFPTAYRSAVIRNDDGARG